MSKPRLFYLSDNNHHSTIYADKSGTFIFFDDWREFVVVIVTADPEFPRYNHGFPEVTYHDATLLKGTRQETKVTEARNQMLVCFPGERLEFAIPEEAISAWVLSLKVPADGGLEDMNLLSEVGRMLNPHDREKLEKAAHSHGL